MSAFDKVKNIFAALGQDIDAAMKEASSLLGCNAADIQAALEGKNPGVLQRAQQVLPQVQSSHPGLVDKVKSFIGLMGR